MVKIHLSKGNKRLVILICFLALGFGITIPISIAFQNVPKNYETITKDFNSGVILVTKEKTFTIPVLNTLMDTKSNIFVYIYPNVTDMNIQSIRLSSPYESLLTYPEYFSPVKTHNIPKEYSLQINARHNGEIINSSENYNIDIYYFKENDNSTLLHSSITFPWNIKTIDMSSITYFWIVLIGVVSGRLITIVQKHQQTIELSKGDIMWIVLGLFAGIFAFSGFLNETKLTNNLVVNIITALVFGLGTEKVLEIARKFPTEDDTKDGGNGDRIRHEDIH